MSRRRWMLALAGAALTVGVADAHGEGPPLSVRIVDPPPVAFESTALGHARHRVRITLANASSRPVALGVQSFRFLATKDGVTYDCADTDAAVVRLPLALDPGAAVTVERAVACETPMPGRYDVEVRAHPRDGSGSETTLGSFVLMIEAGPNAPVRVPWDPRLAAAATATHEIRPTLDPTAVRVIVAMINTTHGDVPLAPAKVLLHVMRRESTAPPCPDRTIDLAFAGTLGVGKSAELTSPVACDFSREGVYDLDVTVLSPSGRAKLAALTVRSAVLPTPHPLPQAKSPLGRQGPF